MPSSTTIVERDVAIPLRDGTILRADVWRSAAGGPSPVLLQRTPYGKGDSFVAIHHAGLEPLRAIDAGFAVVVCDVRGRHGSDGTFVPFVHEAADGADVIAWVADQPFCDGSVCTYGASYPGAAQLLAATRTPPALRAIAPSQAPSTFHDNWTYRGGVLQQGFVDLWLTELGEPVPAHQDWLAHPDDDAYWRATAIRARYAAIDVPALHIGGWHDIFLRGTLENHAGLRAGAATRRARDGQRLLVGPWAHANPTAWVGERDYGSDASQMALDLTGRHVAFFAAALADRLDAIPPVEVFVMGPDRWRTEDQWPPARSRSQRLYLREDAALRPDAPSADERPDHFAYDPADPVPTVGGNTHLPGGLANANAGSRDQRAVEARADVLVYTSAPLTEDLELLGPITASVWAASTAPETDWTVRLTQVDAEGRSMSVTDGILRSRYREGLDRPSATAPGQPARYEIDLGATATVVPAGSRLRAQVSSSDAPRYARHPLAAHQTIFHDPRRPSFLDLSVAEGALC
jgi:predicted acyl esterase